MIIHLVLFKDRMHLKDLCEFMQGIDHVVMSRDKETLSNEKIDLLLACLVTMTQGREVQDNIGVVLIKFRARLRGREKQFLSDQGSNLKFFDNARDLLTSRRFKIDPHQPFVLISRIHSDSIQNVKPSTEAFSGMFSDAIVIAMSSLDKVFYTLLVFVPVSIAALYSSMPPLVVFACAAFAIIPLAKLIGESTEELTTYTGAAVGGFLNATFGNAPELIIAAFALQAGLIDVVKASITGSILSNLLLGLGLAIFLGGTRHKHQKFNATAAKASGSTLLLAVAALIIPAIFVATDGVVTGLHIEDISVIVALLLLVAYIASLFFSLWTHQHLYAREIAAYEPRWSKWKSIAILLGATLAIAAMSEILVSSIEPVVSILGWSQVFIGIVILSIIGNIAEFASAIRVALNDNMDLAFQVAIGSATQIAMFVAPALVLVSFFFAKPMTLIFGAFELVALILAVLIVDTIVEDGESNWFEGMLLLIAYAIIATAFFFYHA